MTAGAHTPLTRAHPDQPANLTDQTAGPEPAPTKPRRPSFTRRQIGPLEQAGSRHGELMRLDDLTDERSARVATSLHDKHIARPSDVERLMDGKIVARSDPDGQRGSGKFSAAVEWAEVNGSWQTGKVIADDSGSCAPKSLDDGRVYGWGWRVFPIADH